jgi:glutamate racemase
MATIGVFDSGIGGLSVAQAIERALPDDTVIFRNDAAHMPYGDKAPQELLELAVPVLQSLVDDGCEVIVIACNTLTTTLITQLRERISVPLVGMEPAVKTGAALTKSKVIAVCATPGTLGSARYQWLKGSFAADVRVIEPDCAQWAYMIEHNQVNQAVIAKQIDEVCDAGADVIVLGCTHYHWIEEEIRTHAKDRAVVIQPEKPVIRQLQRVLGRGEVI